MKTPFIRTLVLAFLTACLGASMAEACANTEQVPVSSATPFSNIGAQVDASYHGNALAIRHLPDGVSLRTDFQRLGAVIDQHGLKLISHEGSGDHLRLKAENLARNTGLPVSFPASGLVEFEDAGSASASLVRFVRPGISEEFTIGTDGVRQDFVIGHRPEGSGELALELSLEGANARAADGSVSLTYQDSGRILSYGKLSVVDALGQHLEADLSVIGPSRLLVRIADDTFASYPLRVDPTFSDADWVSLNPSGMPGADDIVNASAIDAAGNLYVAGYFQFIGNSVANKIAKWDGSTWSGLGSGITGSGSGVSALITIGTTLYVGGAFDSVGGVPAKNIARWNGSTWSALGGGLGGVTSTVSALAASGNVLYAGGIFSDAANPSIQNIAKWNGSQWLPLGTGLNGIVLSLAVQGNTVFAAGYFTGDNGFPLKGIAKWEAGAWSSLGSDMEGTVYALAASSTTLYVAGDIRSVGGITVRSIAKWDGSSWSALGGGIGGDVKCLTLLGSDLYAGGNFSTVRGTGVGYDTWTGSIAKWNGVTWTGLDAGVYGSIRTIAVAGSTVYAGGEFFEAGRRPLMHIAKWNGTAWSGITNGLDGSVTAVVEMKGDVYAAGYFTTADGVQLNHIGKWDGTHWSALGSGIQGTGVLALATDGNALYAGGTFFSAGGVSVMHVAKWEGNSWSALGAGLGQNIVDQNVNSLTMMQGQLYAAGDFTNSGATTVNNVAKWNGSYWVPLGDGLNGEVLCIKATGSDLFAGGGFNSSGGTECRKVAMWNGQVWSDLGGGTDGYVRSLAIRGTDVYVGGKFSLAGAASAKNIAKWNGASWAALGEGLGGDPNHVYYPYPEVYDLAVAGTYLFAGGKFDFSGQTILKNTACWDGSKWLALGSGIAGKEFKVTSYGRPTIASALLVRGSELYVGGSYFTAGGKLSPFLSKVAIPASPVDPFLAAVNAAGLDGQSAAPDATPFNDGVRNLLKFAFHMNLAGPDARELQPGLGAAGLPTVHVQSRLGEQIVIGVQYLRRKGAYLNYTPKISTNLRTWVAMAGSETVINLDAEWERVTLEQTMEVGSATQCFVVVEVKKPN